MHGVIDTTSRSKVASFSDQLVNDTVRIADRFAAAEVRQSLQCVIDMPALKIEGDRTSAVCHAAFRADRPHIDVVVEFITGEVTPA